VSSRKGLVIGIDAANLRQGGGRTHLIELLRAADPQAHGVEQVVVWGGGETLAGLDERPWLKKVRPQALDRGLFERMAWQRASLAPAAQAAQCDLLFVPGGNYAANFHPVVTMSRNMLPFEWPELKRYGFSPIGIKLRLLRVAQSRSFRQADGVIFLTRYAQRQVIETTGDLRAETVIIPHGMNPRFSMEPRPQKPIGEYSAENPYRILYVSIVDQYKHQWQVVAAVGQLRKETNWPLVLELVGTSYGPALKRLNEAIARFDPEGTWVKYHGAVPYTDLHRVYARADLGVFASSCENMPNILIETMAAGLPVACSNRGAMPEVLGDAGVYFDPEQPDTIVQALRHFIASPEARASAAVTSYSAAKAYGWERCARDTFDFLVGIARKHVEGRLACAAS
jgi:glycosyltransferase involved in cell wall biosynthesis